MAEAARVLEDLHEPISERARTALGNVIDLEQARQKQRLQKRRGRQRQPVREQPGSTARNIAPTGAPANDNALQPANPPTRQPETAARGPLRKGTPQLRDTQGKLGPTPNRTPLAMATELQSAQSQDRRAVEALPQPTARDGRVFLELEPQSYARQPTPEEHERKRQEQMMRTSSEFLSPGAAEGATAEIPAAEGARAPQAPPQAEPRRGIAEQARIKGTLQRLDKVSREQIADVQARLDQIQEIRKTAQTFIKLISWAVKIVSGAGSELVLPFIWIILVFNIETLNILIFRVDLPPYINTLLNTAGLNISVDRNRPFSPGNILTVMITVFIDTCIFLILLPTLIGMTITIILILFALTKVLGFLNIGI